ncbi:MAG TPA: hypothetical protein VGL83_14800 [Stellaceae bacterium]
MRALADNVPTPPPSGVAQAPNGALVISSQTCAELAAAKPAVPGADYQPGVDANGHAVTSADLPSSSAPSPTVDNFPIEIDKRFKGSFKLPPGTSGKAILGYVTVRGNQAYFNGQPLNADQSTAIAEACRNAKH